MAPVLFCNVGWMERYEGLTGGDTIVGGGAYVREHESGFEVCNFSPIAGSFMASFAPQDESTPSILTGWEQTPNLTQLQASLLYGPRLVQVADPL